MQCFASPCKASISKSVAPSTSSDAEAPDPALCSFLGCLYLLKKTHHYSLKSETWLILHVYTDVTKQVANMKRHHHSAPRFMSKSAKCVVAHIAPNATCEKKPKHPSLWYWKFNEKFNRKWDVRLVHVSTHACHEPGTSPSAIKHQCHHSMFLQPCWFFQGPDQNPPRDLPKVLRFVDQTHFLHIWT